LTVRRPLAAAAVATLVAGCAAPQGTVVLLPDAAGRDTAVTVTQGSAALTLDRPYAAARLTSAGPEPYRSSAAEVDSRFSAARAALPAPPQRFTLYFIEGKDEFTEASKLALDGVLVEITHRPVPDVLVVGHTDSTASDAVNDPLSRQRAEVVRHALIARGIPADSVTASGRGKREPVVPTADGVAEPRNRRVEIQVR
jgi:OmpA-OmpF porin, OOP family